MNQSELIILTLMACLFFMACEPPTEPLEEQKSFKVYYQGNGHDSGTPPKDESYYLYDEEFLVLQSEDLEKENHHFTHWNTQQNGKGTNYIPGQAGKIKDQLILYAIWEETQTYNVFYHKNGAEGGNVPIDENSYPSNSIAVTMEGISLQRDSYFFQNWNTDPSGKGESYEPGDNIYLKNQDIHLYAQWLGFAEGLFLWEFDTDQEGRDGYEFIEIWNNSTEDIDFDQDSLTYLLVFINGSDNKTYIPPIQLEGKVLKNDIFTIASTNFENSNQVLPKAEGNFQNGTDAVLLLKTHRTEESPLSDFPLDTAIPPGVFFNINQREYQKIDALIYCTADDKNPELEDILGVSMFDEAARGQEEYDSLHRVSQELWDTYQASPCIK